MRPGRTTMLYANGRHTETRSSTARWFPAIAAVTIAGSNPTFSFISYRLFRRFTGTSLISHSGDAPAQAGLQKFRELMLRIFRLSEFGRLRTSAYHRESRSRRRRAQRHRHGSQSANIHRHAPRIWRVRKHDPFLKYSNGLAEHSRQQAPHRNRPISALPDHAQAPEDHVLDQAPNARSRTISPFHRCTLTARGTAKESAGQPRSPAGSGYLIVHSFGMYTAGDSNLRSGHRLISYPTRARWA